MARALLVRGMLAGLVAAVLAVGFGSLFGEPQIGNAIALEGHHAEAHGAAAEPELVSRTVQSTIGLATAVGLYGVALGGVLALVFAFAYGRLANTGPRATAGLVTLAGFVAVELAPFLKYPANPPAVGNPDTIGMRTTLYFLMIGLSLLVAIASTYVARRLVARVGTWNAVLIGVGTFIVVTAVVGSLLPTVNEVSAEFPATVLWQFRIASLGTQVVLWGAFGLVFGVLAQRVLQPRASLFAPAVPGRLSRSGTATLS